MTSDLEQKFYDTFGIEPKIDYDYKTIIQNVTKTGYWFDKEYLIKIFNDNQKFKVIQVRKNINYSEITAEKIIQIFLVLNQWYDWRYGVDIEAENVENFKKEVLQKCIDTYNKGWVAYDGFEPKNTGLYEGIRQLFKD